MHQHMSTGDFPAPAGNPIDDSPPTFNPILPFATSSDLAAKYEIGAELGRGQFGIISSCKCRHSSSRFACKSISKSNLHSSRDVNNVVQEVLIMKKLSESTSFQPCATIDKDHSYRCNHFLAPSCGIVRLHNVIEDSEFVHLIMDLCKGGDLYERITKKTQYPEVQAASLFKGLLTTMQLCHDKGVMHRDLKPENILFVDDCDKSAISLADFGLAIEFTPGQTVSGIAGSIFYMAPEMLRGEAYSEKIDVWSAGVILYVLLSGVPPFWEPTEKETFKAIQEGNLIFPPDPWGGISLSAKDLICHMICTDVESRFTIAQALKHPWIVQHSKRSRARPSQSYHGFRQACYRR